MPGFDINRFIGLDESLAQHLNCSVCLNIFDNAINCECGHTFCKSCIQQLLTTGNKTCPECRQVMATRKREHSLSAHNNSGVVVVKGYLMTRNLKINSIISDLRIKCDFEFNGCRELICLGLLSDHLKNCQHRNCETCGFTAGRVGEHNCLQLLKNDRNEWKRKYENSENSVHKLKKQVLKLQRKVNSLEENEDIDRCVNDVIDSIHSESVRRSVRMRARRYDSSSSSDSSSSDSTLNSFPGFPVLSPIHSSGTDFDSSSIGQNAESIFESDSSSEEEREISEIQIQ